MPQFTYHLRGANAGLLKGAERRVAKWLEELLAPTLALDEADLRMRIETRFPVDIQLVEELARKLQGWKKGRYDVEIEVPGYESSDEEVVPIDDLEDAREQLRATQAKLARYESAAIEELPFIRLEGVAERTAYIDATTGHKHELAKEYHEILAPVEELGFEGELENLVNRLCLEDKAEERIRRRYNEDHPDAFAAYMSSPHKEDHEFAIERTRYVGRVQDILFAANEQMERWESKSQHVVNSAKKRVKSMPVMISFAQDERYVIEATLPVTQERTLCTDWMGTIEKLAQDDEVGLEKTVHGELVTYRRTLPEGSSAQELGDAIVGFENYIREGYEQTLASIVGIPLKMHFVSTVLPGTIVHEESDPWGEHSEERILRAAYVLQSLRECEEGIPLTQIHGQLQTKPGYEKTPASAVRTDLKLLEEIGAVERWGRGRSTTYHSRQE